MRKWLLILLLLLPTLALAQTPDPVGEDGGVKACQQVIIGHVKDACSVMSATPTNGTSLPSTARKSR